MTVESEYTAVIFIITGKKALKDEIIKTDQEDVICYTCVQE